MVADGYAGPKASGLTELNVESFQALTARLPLALLDGFAPSCTSCADNPIFTPPGMSPAGLSSWSSYGVLSGIPITDVRANLVLLREAAVVAPGTSYKIPVSPYYAFRTVVHRAAVSARAGDAGGSRRSGYVSRSIWIRVQLRVEAALPRALLLSFSGRADRP